MAHLTPSALRLMQRQHNIISIRQLRAGGVSRAAQMRMIHDGLLEHVGQSVLRVPGTPVTFESRLIVLCLQHPHGFVTGPTVGTLERLRRMPRLSEIHFCLPHGSKSTMPPGVKLRQSNFILPEHTRALDNGVVVASWPRLAFDLASDLPLPDLASVIEQMLQRHECTVIDLARVARQMCVPGRRGSALFAQVLLERGGRAPVESHPELTVLTGLNDRGVPVVPQVSHLQLVDGARVRIDMAVESARWAVEVDVHPNHITMPGSARDKQRDRRLHLIDWQVERVSAVDLLDLDGILDELEMLYRARVAALTRRA
jgi:hypothetical protein